MRKLWFKRRRYGWGWYPACWQGWCVTATFATLILTGMTALTGYIELYPESTPMATFVFLILTGIVTGGLIFICYKTGERPRWQWGEETKRNDI